MEQPPKSRPLPLRMAPPTSGREQILREAEEEQKRGERPIVYLREFPLPQKLEETHTARTAAPSGQHFPA